MDRKEILYTAQQCVCVDREKSYGSPVDNFRVVAAMWEIYLKARCVEPGADVCINPEDVAALMSLLKIGRLATGGNAADNWVDIAGYAALGGEIASMQAAEAALEGENNETNPR